MCTFALLSIVGAGISAAGSVVQGVQANQAAKAQAAAYEQQARADAQASAYEAQKERRQQELVAANARAQVGASGVAFSGSPTEVLSSNAQQGALDIAAIQYGSQLRQNNLTTQAGISRASGKSAMVGGLINAGSSFVSGITNLYDPSRAVRFGGSAFS